MSRLGVLAEGEVLSSNPLSFFFNGLQTTLILVNVAWRILGLLRRSPLLAPVGGRCTACNAVFQSAPSSTTDASILGHTAT
jgi:hypothetical protein